MKHYCGLFSIIPKKKETNTIKDLVNGLNSLQHRGQDSAGISYIDTCSDVIQTYKDVGLVKDVFNFSNEDSLTIDIKKNIRAGISHVRYSTRDKTCIEKQKADCQPFILSAGYQNFTFAHNGNVDNIGKLYDKYNISLTESEKIIESDSYILGKILQKMILEEISKDKSEGKYITKPIWKHALIRFVNEISGVYCLLVMTNDAVYAVKDSSGIRPLCISETEESIKISSESIAFLSNDIEMGDSSLYELESGEIICVDFSVNSGNPKYKSIFKKPLVINTFCSFEYIYFFRHNSVYKGKTIEDIRINLGKELARQSLNNKSSVNSVVICIPQTAISSARGFSSETNIPFIENAIVKSKLVNRTFILQNDEERQNACKKKFIYDRESLEGKDVYLIDDSIVRGNTLKIVVKELLDNNVKSVHIRIPSPPIVSECYFGIDMSTKAELIAYNCSVDEMVKMFKVDSLEYLTIPSMKKAFARGNDHNSDNVCTSCFTGKYNSELLDW
jgi:amidophosphoribosyltransferase